MSKQIRNVILFFILSFIWIWIFSWIIVSFPLFVIFCITNIFLMSFIYIKTKLCYKEKRNKIIFFIFFDKC